MVRPKPIIAVSRHVALMTAAVLVKRAYAACLALPCMNTVKVVLAITGPDLGTGWVGNKADGS